MTPLLIDLTMPPFKRGTRLLTAPIEAAFPYTLSVKYPYPAGDFKSLAIENIIVHFTDGTPMVEVPFPRSMRYFGKDNHHPNLRRFDSGIRFPDDVLKRCLNFHLSYDIDKHVIDGYVDYLPSAHDSKIDFIELEYAIAFSPVEG